MRGPSGSSITASVQEGGGRDAIYVATVPLRATGGPARLLASAGYSLRLWELQHFMVIVKRHEGSSSAMRAVVFDFQPCDPENIYVAIAALSRKRVPGVILKRTLNRMPKSRCWFIGICNSDAVEVANKFNEGWDTNLIIGTHDCRHYTNGLVGELTGKDSILEHLRTKGLDS
ncbi:unnamed protein product [Spirodela intermedia]|uniref:Uncharacterized protein n=1 Tax=Spirodela intermedia TaxID=51605 RepID=A0A7I8LDJ6_SPIIN|nr:unnamed protein product [Spirodela intermedia]